MQNRNKTKKATIFGTGAFAELASFYLEADSEYSVEAFCKTNPEADTYLGKSLFDFEKIQEHCPPSEYEMFIAVGYRKMNALRRQYCEQAREKGYKLLSYISSKATFWGHENNIGDNVFIFEDNTIQPCVSIGDGTILWSGNHIGHHSKINKYCFITSHVVISGYCIIGNQSFLGVNSTLTDTVNLGEKVLVGAGALVSKNLLDEKVILGQKGMVVDKKSSMFLR